MREISLDTPLFEIVGARAPALRRLEKLGIKTAGDLLWHFPSRYEDFSKMYKVAELEPGQQATVQGLVEEVTTRRSWRKSMSIVEATVSDDTGAIRAVWFNQPYVANVLKTGRMANFAGKVSVAEDGDIYLSHPAYEVLHGAALAQAAAGGEDNESAGTDVEPTTKHTGRLVPVYPETRGLTSRGIRFAVQTLFKHGVDLDEWIPPSVLAEFSFPPVDEAIHSVHFPRHIEDAHNAKKRFSFEDLFLLHILNGQQKQKFASERAPSIAADVGRVKSLLSQLPFELTPSQKKSLWEIMKDMERPQPMNRLLQGDVGSGKTVVAAIAALITAEHGHQTAFMAPTEILARQHFETMKKLFAAIKDDAPAPANALPATGLLTGSSAVIFYEPGVESRVPKNEFNKKAAAGEIKIIFGTHALIQKSVSFHSLGLVIVDEQHRFGVRQRAELAGKNAGTEAGNKKSGGAATPRAPVPHFLSMSATPIPRTLMLSVFGDLDLSLITELPGGRKPIETKIVTPIERQKTYDFIRAEVKDGRQVFVICPRIDPEETDATGAGAAKKPQFWNGHEIKKMELKSVKEEFEKLSAKIFPDLRIAMLHGQMKPKEKEEVMEKFQAREFDILVATSVVEVGVDVPNATIMMIEGAERFGLAQLYQFRGRVGRGEHQSYCFLMADSAGGGGGSTNAASANGSASHARLRAILEAKNGFELAEKDLELRGPGQFFGDVQTGLPDIAMEALKDPVLVQGSRAAANRILAESPTLAKYDALKARMDSFRKKVHRE